MVMTETSLVLVLTTVGAEMETATLAEALVGDGLAACVGVLPGMVSTYRWEGRVERAQEQQLVIKTTMDRVAALSDRLRALHPYEVPEVLVVPVIDADPRYASWLRSAVSAATPDLAG